MPGGVHNGIAYCALPVGDTAKCAGVLPVDAVTATAKKDKQTPTATRIGVVIG